MYNYIKSSLIKEMVNNSTNINKTNKHIYHLKSLNTIQTVMVNDSTNINKTKTTYITSNHCMQKDQRICWWKFDLL